MGKHMNIEMLPIEPLADIKIISETLTRMGIANRGKKIIWPSCYLYESASHEFFLLHFKQVFSTIKDDSYNNMSEDDYVRRNSIAFCLKNWGLINTDDELIKHHDKMIFTISHEEKKDWKISHKVDVKSVKIGSII
jgi:hypothetical protein